MNEGITKSRIDRLGDRLRKGNISESDLRRLDQYRLSFTGAYEFVVGTIRKELGREPIGRSAKSTTSISEKLRRESIRLSQIQDIAGCRIVVSNITLAQIQDMEGRQLIAPDIVEQGRIVESLVRLFKEPIVVDRREEPSHGYRAVHVIVRCEGKLVEIQVRTALQHLWAELSEKASDVIDPAIKYGGGDEAVRDSLLQLSAKVAAAESLDEGLTELLAQVPSLSQLPDALRQLIAAQQKDIRAVNRALFGDLQKVISEVTNLKGDHDAVSN